MPIEVKKITHLRWRQFMDSDAGKDGMLWLRDQQPNIPKGQPHEVQYDAGASEGYRRAIEKITELLAIDPEPNEKNLENP